MIFFSFIFLIFSVRASAESVGCLDSLSTLSVEQTKMFELLNEAIEKIDSPKGSYQMKVKFFQEILPDVLAAQLIVETERERLISLKNKDNLSHEEKEFLLSLKEKYKASSYEELIQRVDVVPLELVLVQAAKESGWGSSASWKKCNNVAGIYAYTGLSVCDTPSRKLAHFSSRQDSFSSYLLSLNRNENYREFREKRAQMRRENQRPDGVTLSQYLLKYSIKKEIYTKSIKKIIESHNLDVIIAEALALSEDQ